MRALAVQLRALNSNPASATAGSKSFGKFLDLSKLRFPIAQVEIMTCFGWGVEKIS